MFLHLKGKGAEHKAVRDLAVIAFWGMARMSKLTYPTSTTTGVAKGVQAMDVSHYKNFLTVTIREAKTAAPGET
jgi:hypothetical protein